jgi:hypothetical protein
MADMEDREGEASVCNALQFPEPHLPYFCYQTALHKAALNGHLDIVKYLLPQKAEVHSKDADGWTALHNACSKVSSYPIS